MQINKVRKAVIPAAGLGTRMLPIARAVPKEILPIVDRPAISYLVEEAARSGITDVLRPQPMRPIPLLFRAQWLELWAILRA